MKRLICAAASQSAPVREAAPAISSGPLSASGESGCNPRRDESKPASVRPGSPGRQSSLVRAAVRPMLLASAHYTQFVSLRNPSNGGWRSWQNHGWRAVPSGPSRRPRATARLFSLSSTNLWRRAGERRNPVASWQGVTKIPRFSSKKMCPPVSYRVDLSPPGAVRICCARGEENNHHYEIWTILLHVGGAHVNGATWNPRAKRISRNKPSS